mmetsp:Transcript_17710/g.54775  ORF Transcript_17710/g.54775 Transcript_17710/m.54775 type:complete len:175 (-) Transcript_17710:72-596(-)
MAYTHAAWRCVPWPARSSGEDGHFLRGFAAAGLPVAARAETGRAVTVLHLQHGANMGRSVCQAARADTAAIAALLERFEEACRRIINLPQAEYDQMGGRLLYQGLHSLALTAEPPPAAKGLYLLTDDGGAEYEQWKQSSVGLHPQRERMLRRQREHLCQRAAPADAEPGAGSGE